MLCLISKHIFNKIYLSIYKLIFFYIIWILANYYLRKMLEKDPEKRINMFKIMNHKWFDLKDKDIEEVSKVVGNLYFQSYNFYVIKSFFNN